MAKKHDPAIGKTLALLAETKRSSAEATVDWRIGEAVCEILKERDTLTLSDLLEYFTQRTAESASAKRGGDPAQDMARISAEAVIRRLLSMRPETR